MSARTTLVGLLVLILCSGIAWSADSAVPGGFATIQLAIDDAGTVAGDTITVSGTHFESAVHITKAVTIAGLGIGVTSIDPAGGVGLYVDTDGVTIRDLTIENGSNGVRFELAAGTIDGTTLDSVEFLNNTSNGIEVHNATTVTNFLAKDCNFETTKTGIRVSSSGHMDGVEFRDTTFLSNDIGIYESNDGGSSTMKNLLVTGCTFTDHSAGQGTAIFLEEIQDAVIENNTFVNNRRDIQIFKWYQASLPVSNVMIRDNTMTGTTNAVLAMFNREHDGAFDPGQTEFDGVSFVNNTANTAIAVDASAVYAGGHSGPSLGGIGWDTVVISCNTFTGLTTPGDGVRYYNPGVPDTEVLGVGNSLDVTNNYWGTADAGTVAGLMQIPAVTIFSPFLDAPPVPGNCPPPVPVGTPLGFVALILSLAAALLLKGAFPNRSEPLRPTAG